MVEVTLAIGITAVALVSLMGMLPKGMQTLQRANDKAVMARIHQQVLGEIQLTPWEDSDGSSQIETFDGQIRYYDDQGIEIPANDSGSLKHVYTARILVPRSNSKLPESVGGGTHGGVRVPGETALVDGALPTDFLRLVIVEITGIASPDFQANPESGFEDPENRKMIFTYQTFAVKMGQEYGTEAE